MEHLLETAAANQRRAREIIRTTGLEAIWRSVGAEPRLVGSLRTGLLMTHRDIDFHVYSSPLRLADSFAAVRQNDGNNGRNHEKIDQKHHCRPNGINKKSTAQGINGKSRRQQVKLKAPVVAEISQSIVAERSNGKNRQQQQKAFQNKICSHVFFALCKIPHFLNFSFLLSFKLVCI